MAEIKFGHYQCPTCLSQETLPLNGEQPTPICVDCLCEMALMVVSDGPTGDVRKSHEKEGGRPRRRRVAAKAIVNDIRSGMTDSDLMMKYRTSSKGLQRLFRKLIEVKAVSHSEVYDRSPTYRSAADVISSRRFPRIDVKFPLRIFDTESHMKGLVRDVSENGMRVAGIETDVAEVKTLQIPLEGLIRVDPLLVQASCRWVQTKGKTNQYVVSGFEITDISEDAFQDLRNFVRLLHSGDGEIGKR